MNILGLGIGIATIFTTALMFVLYGIVLAVFVVVYPTWGIAWLACNLLALWRVAHLLEQRRRFPKDSDMPVPGLPSALD